jgi:hypothetical protein
MLACRLAELTLEQSGDTEETQLINPGGPLNDSRKNLTLREGQQVVRLRQNQSLVSKMNTSDEEVKDTYNPTNCLFETQICTTVRISAISPVFAESSAVGY